MDCNEEKRLYDTEQRIWNGKIHILSDQPELAFAWAAYFANHSDIYVNGRKYRVECIFNAGLEFANGTYLSYGNYVIFKSELGLTVYTYEYLKELRKTSSISVMICFTEEQFFRIDDLSESCV